MGLLFFLLSLQNYTGIFKLVKRTVAQIDKKTVLLKWRIIFFLTSFLMLACIYRIYILINVFPENPDLIISFVYLFGGVYVYYSTSLSLTTMDCLSKTCTKLLNVSEQLANQVKLRALDEDKRKINQRLLTLLKKFKK